MFNINQWSLLLAFRMGKRLNLLFSFHSRKTRSNKEAQKVLLEDLNQMGIHLKEHTIRRKRKLARTLSEYCLIHFLRVGKWKIDKYCEPIARYLNYNPEEAKFWRQNYLEWCKTTRQQQPAEIATNKSLVDNNTSGPEIDDSANDLFLKA